MFNIISLFAAELEEPKNWHVRWRVKNTVWIEQFGRQTKWRKNDQNMAGFILGQ